MASVSAANFPLRGAERALSRSSLDILAEVPVDTIMNPNPKPQSEHGFSRVSA